MLESAAELANKVISQAIEVFLEQLEPLERMALSTARSPRAELRHIMRNNRSEIHPVIVFECDSLAHRAALLCLKERLCYAAANVGISGICLAVRGENDIGFLCPTLNY